MDTRVHVRTAGRKRIAAAAVVLSEYALARNMPLRDALRVGHGALTSIYIHIYIHVDTLTHHQSAVYAHLTQQRHVFTLTELVCVSHTYILRCICTLHVRYCSITTLRLSGRGGGGTRRNTILRTVAARYCINLLLVCVCAFFLMLLAFVALIKSRIVGVWERESEKKAGLIRNNFIEIFAVLCSL